MKIQLLITVLTLDTYIREWPTDLTVPFTFLSFILGSIIVYDSVKLFTLITTRNHFNINT